jgi:hypothetical protein
MHRVHARRVASAAGCCLFVLLLGACHGGGAKAPAETAVGGSTVDVKSACAALAGLERSSDALNGVDLGDPATSMHALAVAVAEYSTALLTFERVGPADLRARAEAVRLEVVAHHFGQAAVARAAIDTWATQHCA